MWWGHVSLCVHLCAECSRWKFWKNLRSSLQLGHDPELSLSPIKCTLKHSHDANILIKGLFTRSVNITVFVGGMFDLFDCTETDNLYHFFWANQEKVVGKLFSWTQHEFCVNRCDWIILAGNEKRIGKDCLNCVNSTKWLYWTIFKRYKKRWHWQYV